MIYHVNVNIGRQLTGIESAAIQRHKLLSSEGNSKIITIRYNMNLQKNASLYGLTTDDYINMYDFLQDVTYGNSEGIVSLSRLFPDTKFTLNKVNSSNDYRVYSKEQYVAYVHLYENNSIAYINYFDREKKKRKRQIFDPKGFLSCECVLNSNQKAVTEIYYTPSGDRCIEKFYSYDNISKETLIIVHDSAGCVYLASEAELITYFFSKLFTKEDIVLLDKNILVAGPLVETQNVGKRVAILHSKHYSGIDPLNGRISAPYKNVFNHLDSFDYIVCSTQKQRQDLVDRFDDENKFRCIPVGIRKECQKNSLEVGDNTKIRIGVVARYYVEKRLDHVIKAFKKIHWFLPNTELHLYGFGDAREKYKTEKELIELRHQLNLDDSVKFRGYLVDLDDEYKQMHLILLTSSFEGFCLALLEGISYGVPAVSYDINYGPRDMVESGRSGYLVKDGDIEALADKVIEVLSDPKRYTDFSMCSYEKSKQFAKEQLFDKWKKIID